MASGVQHGARKRKKTAVADDIRSIRSFHQWLLPCTPGVERTQAQADAGHGERRARPAPGTDPHWPAPGPDMSDSLHAGIRYGRGRY